jgi:hypothetical protein
VIGWNFHVKAMANIHSHYHDAVDSQFISQECMDCSVRIDVGFSVSRAMVYRLLRGIGVEKGEVVALYQKRMSKEWFAVFSTSVTAMMVVAKGQATLMDSVVTFSLINKEKVRLRIHWLPAYISNGWVEEVFGCYGTVHNVGREFVTVDGDRIETGVRGVILEVSEKDKHHIPHLLDMNDGLSVLVTCKGRMSLCLRCFHLGHVRKDCTFGREAPGLEARKSYARAVSSPKVVQVNADVPDEDDGFYVKCDPPEYYLRAEGAQVDGKVQNEGPTQKVGQTQEGQNVETVESAVVLAAEGVVREDSVCVESTLDAGEQEAVLPPVNLTSPEQLGSLVRTLEDDFIPCGQPNQKKVCVDFENGLDCQNPFEPLVMDIGDDG